MIRINNIKLNPTETESDLRKKVADKLKIDIKSLQTLKFHKKSIDARRKDHVHFVCTVDVTIDGDERKRISRLRDKNITEASTEIYHLPQKKQNPGKVIVVGFGPAGMFAALILAECGISPIIIERGDDIDTRQKKVQNFWSKRILDDNSNVQFGEGGAGTFSDGKLTTGINDSRIRKVLETFFEAGAPDSILFEAKPHIGTDRLPQAVKGIRRRIQSLGGTIHFRTKLEALLVKDEKIFGVRVKTESNVEDWDCENVILATGHSARDTYEALFQMGIPMEAKSFSVGARIEHRAELINKAQFGSFHKEPALGAAEYKLSCHLPTGRGAYTFCMCPGGVVTGAASEAGGVVTNGMSNLARNSENSNSALLVGVSPADFVSNSENGMTHPLSGIYFQRQLEQHAFHLTGGNFTAPAQRVEDFQNGRKTLRFGDVTPTYLPGVEPSDITVCLPEYVTVAMRQAVLDMNRRLKGFAHPDAVLTAPETRSSAPVRIMRGESMQSPKVIGMFPCGEGAGFAGGIMSAAVDGIKCAEALMQGYVTPMKP